MRHMMSVCHIAGDDLALRKYTQKYLRVSVGNLFSNGSKKIIWRENDHGNLTNGNS